MTEDAARPSENTSSQVTETTGSPTKKGSVLERFTQPVVSKLGALLHKQGSRAAMEQLATHEEIPPATAKDVVTRITAEQSLKSTRTGEEREISTLEKTTATNDRLASALYTLIVSVPDGERRDALFDQFPELNRNPAYQIDIEMELADDKESAAAQIQTQLETLVERAVNAVGGPEKASLFLKYPGLTDDESLENVRSVPDEWYQTSMAANTRAPQMALGIFTKLGQRVTQDMIAGTTHWDDALYAYLDKDQIEDEKNLVSKLHVAHREEPAMPTGHEHHRKLKTIQDAEFQALWRGEMKGVITTVLKMAQWAEDTSHVLLPLPNIPSDYDKLPVDQSNASRLDAFFSHPALRPYVEMTTRMYQAAARALDSDNGILLQKQQRRENTSRKPELSYDIPAERGLEDLVAEALAAEVEQLKAEYSSITFPLNLARVFADSLAYFGSDEELEYPTP